MPLPASTENAGLCLNGEVTPPLQQVRRDTDVRRFIVCAIEHPRANHSKQSKARDPSTRSRHLDLAQYTKPQTSEQVDKALAKYALGQEVETWRSTNTYREPVPTIPMGGLTKNRDTLERVNETLEVLKSERIKSKLHLKATRYMKQRADVKAMNGCLKPHMLEKLNQRLEVILREQKAEKAEKAAAEEETANRAWKALKELKHAEEEAKRRRRKVKTTSENVTDAEGWTVVRPRRWR